MELPCFTCSRISDCAENHTSSRMMINKPIMRTFMSALCISCCGNRDCSVSIVTSLRAGRPRNRGSISDRVKVYTCAPKSPDRLCPPLPPFSLLFSEHWGLCGGKLTGAWDLTTSLSRATVKSVRSYTSTALYSFMTCASRDNREVPSCALNPCFVFNKLCDGSRKIIIVNQ